MLLYAASHGQVRRLSRLAILLTVATFGRMPTAGAQEAGEVLFFDGKTLDNWSAVLSDPALKKEDVWSVAEGGVLVCRGRGRRSGYIRSTLGDFENYTLRLQWRFPAGTPGGNSGVLVHTTTPNALNVWPKSMEAQLNHQNAGDIWVIGTTCEIENAAERVKGRRHLNLTDDSEKPIGEWNDYEIICDGDQITIKVNGVLVNHVTKCSSSKGAICLQAEGADIEFRNIRLTPLKK
jgi:hypothetical protein